MSRNTKSLSTAMDALLKNIQRHEKAFGNHFEEKESKETFFYPFVKSPEDLKLVPFYGDMPMYLIPEPTLTVPVVRDNFQRPEIDREIQRRALRCVDSIPMDAQPFASLAVDFSNVIFGVRRIIQRNENLCHSFVAPNEEQDYNFSRSEPLSLYSMGHHHQHPDDNRILQILLQSGASVKEANIIPETVTIRLKSSSGSSERHRLHLNSSLEFRSWETQEWDPMKCHLVSTHESGYGLLLRSRIRRRVTKEEICRALKKKDSNFPEILTKSNLGGLLVKKGRDSYVIKRNSCIKSLYRVHEGKSYELEMNGVSFKFETVSWSEHRFLADSTRSFLIAKGNCKSQLSFPVHGNEHETMTKVVSQISSNLLKAIRENSLLLSAVSFQIPTVGHAASIDCQAVQKLRRLKFESGPLHQLLGLPENVTTSTAKLNCLFVLRLIKNYRPMVMSSLNLRVQDLESKLKDAASKVGIRLENQNRSNRYQNEKRDDQGASSLKWRDNMRIKRRSFSPLCWRRDH